MGGEWMKKLSANLSSERPETRKLTLDRLPPANTRRWVIRRKAQIVEAVRTGVLSLDEACDRYTLSIEEFLSWQRLFDSHGVHGLRVTRLQEYRNTNQKL